MIVHEPSAVTVAASGRSAVVVWIDAEGATLCRWAGAPRIVRMASDIPSRHDSTGNVRHDPRVRSGGGGAAQDRITRHRDGHVRDFVAAVAGAIAPDEEVEVVGPAGLRDELARLLRSEDVRRGNRRVVVTSPGFRLTEPQLIARVRERLGEAAARVGRGPEHHPDRPGPG